MLTIYNPCELEYFDFISVLFDQIEYTIGEPQLTSFESFKNTKGADNCNVYVVKIFYDASSTGEFSAEANFASAKANNNKNDDSTLSISVQSSDYSARKRF